MELKASRISDGLESAEAILSCKSSFQQLELFKIVAKSELDFNTLDSKATVEVSEIPRIHLSKNPSKDLLRNYGWHKESQPVPHISSQFPSRALPLIQIT